MNETNRAGQTGRREILAEWEGPALHEPGVLFGEEGAKDSAAGTDVPELAAWIAVTVLGTASDNTNCEGIRAKVIDALSTWQQRFGRAKVAEIKRQLVQQLEKYRNNRRITEEELNKRIEFFFAEISGNTSPG